MVSSELRRLLEQYLDGTISGQDLRRLWKSLPKSEHESDWHEAIDHIITARSGENAIPMANSAKALEAIKIKMARSKFPQGIYRIYRNHSRQIIAAAAVLVLICTSIVFFTSSQNNSNSPVAAVSKPIQNDVKPGTKMALLKLADGTTINLDNIAPGKIAQQGNVEVIKSANGELLYKAESKLKDKEAVSGSNMVYTPRGGQYQLLLPDGSKIWLNAESSITYPVVFTGNKREVKITGEVYLEVAKDKNRPFIVFAEDTKIEVLGTHFNVNAYRDGESVKTSLLEGSVKIDKDILKPGEAYINGKIIPTNVEQDVAWKNGVFNFNDLNLSQIMRQLARWYDLEVVFAQGVPNKQYAGEIGRNLNLSQVLKGLENSGVRFDLLGKHLTVRH